VEQVLFKALAKEPENRFESMGDFAVALEKLSRGEQPDIGPVPEEAETVMQTVVAAPAHAKPGKIQKPVSAPPEKKRMEGWKFGLMALVVVVVLGTFCVLVGGGAVFASRFVMNGQATTKTTDVVVAATEMTQATSEPPQQTVATIESSTGVTPFQTIKGFPDDVPFLKENNGDLTTSTSQGMVTYSFTSNLSFEQISDFYKSGMIVNGWELANETTQDSAVMWYFIKGDNRMVGVTVYNQGEKNKMIAIMVISQ
jgi:cytoskeletal protein RodZ